MIEMNNCLDGHLYSLDDTKLTYGVYRKDWRQFIGIQNKYGKKFLEDTWHIQANNGKGAVPLQCLEKCPIHPIKCNSIELFLWLEQAEKDYAPQLIA